MLSLFLFEVVEEDVDESAAAMVEGIEVLTALDEAAVADEALAAAAALKAACIFPFFFSIDFPSRKAGRRSIIFCKSLLS